MPWRTAFSTSGWRHDVPPRVVERIAKEITQARDHRHGRPGFAAAHQRGDGVKRIEKEMRLELEPQVRQLCLRELGLHARRFELPLAQPPPRVDRVHHPADRPVDDQVDVKKRAEPAHVTDDPGPWRRWAERLDEEVHDFHPGHLDEREEEAHREMERDRFRPRR